MPEFDDFADVKMKSDHFYRHCFSVQASESSKSKQRDDRLSKKSFVIQENTQLWKKSDMFQSYALVSVVSPSLTDLS